jgi:hypothetical protein
MTPEDKELQMLEQRGHMYLNTTCLGMCIRIIFRWTHGHN